MASSNFYNALTVDEMLQGQKKNNWKKSNTSIVHNLSLPQVSFKFYNIIEALSSIMLKLRRVYFVGVILLLIWAFGLSITNLVVSGTSKISFSSEEKEIALLSNHMESFISTTPIDDFDENGNLTLQDLSNIKFEQPVTYSTYTVKSGDNISSISKKFGLTNISTLISVNSINNVRKLYVGDTLEIPSIDGIVYTVQNGDTLSHLANNYDIPIESLLDVNNLTTSILRTGQKLFIPGIALDSNSLKKALGELFTLPLKTSYRISSPYGYRPDPFTGQRKFHTGIDMAAPLGSAIRAAMSGTVVAASYSSIYGNYVILRHVNGYQTLYAHMSSISVKIGQEISQGGRLGALGSTGYSTGPHLHFSVYKNGKLVNPTTVLKF